MGEIRFSIGDIAIYEGMQNRIIYLTSESVVLCQMDTSKLNIVSLPLDFFQKEIEDNRVIILEDIDSSIVDAELLSPAARRKFEHKQGIIREVTKAYGPSYVGLIGTGRKETVDELIKTHHVSRKIFWITVRRFLQSGLKESSLLPLQREQKQEVKYQHKPGKKGTYGITSDCIVDDDIKQVFQKGLEYYRSGRAKSIRLAFDMINSEFFSETTVINGTFSKKLFPFRERPTIDQFRYYCEKRLTAEEKDVIKTSKMEQRNDKRLLLGEAGTRVQQPGEKVEVDAVEVDLSLISLTSMGQTVGRPIVYAMKDVRTRAIVAISVAFDNNSRIGLTNLLLNLGDDKVEYCKKFGITLEDTRLWPSNFIPMEMYVDRGSDFTSKEFERICNELGITRHLVPGGTGSLKGVIEQWFHQMHSMINTHTEKRGLIEKRHDSKHHKEAVLTISDFTRMLIGYVLNYNQLHMEGYKPTKDEILHHVDASPASLWEYNCKVYGPPRPIQNRVDYLFKLMLKTQATVSRVGIEFKHLLYINYEDKTLLADMYRLQNRKSKLDIRYDPRDNSQVFYVRDGELVTAVLNTDHEWMQDLKGLTFKETEDYWIGKKTLDKSATQTIDQVRANAFDLLESIVTTAEAEAPKGADPTNLRVARGLEQQYISKTNTIGDRLIDEGKNIGRSKMLASPSHSIEGTASECPDEPLQNRNETPLTVVSDDEYYDILENY